METTNKLTASSPAEGASSCHGSRNNSGSWLHGRRGLVVGGVVAVAAVALALSQSWLALPNLIPLLFVLPCALMMLMCMKGNHGQETDKTLTVARPETTVAAPVRNGLD